MISLARRTLLVLFLAGGLLLYPAESSPSTQVAPSPFSVNFPVKSALYAQAPTNQLFLPLLDAGPASPGEEASASQQEGEDEAAVEQAAVERPEYVPGEVILVLKDDVPLDRISEIHSQFRTRALRRFAFIRAFQLALPDDLSVTDAVRLLRRHPLVQEATPNYYRYIDIVPDDADFGDLWGLHNVGQDGGTPDADIDAPEAWDITVGSRDVVVAVIDSGVDLTHPDLVDNLWTNPGEIAGNGIDDDGNGFVDDVHGWDFSSDDNDPSPVGGACQGHGTHVAGTIGASGNNGIGVSGVNWNVTIMPLKAFRSLLGVLCTASDADLLAAIQYHTMMGVRISSNSWGGPAPSMPVALAIRASDSVFVAAAGNESNDNDVQPSFPANYPLSNIVSVAATDRNDLLADFSNYGVNSVDLGAPGVDILSTLPNNQYDAYSGTSMATPHVSAVAALLMSQDPDLTNNEIIWRILNGTDDIGLPVITQGRLNAERSLQFGLSPQEVVVSVTPQGPTDVSPGSTLSVEVTVTNNSASTSSGVFRIYARLPNGKEVSTPAIPINLNPGQSQSVVQSVPVPANATAGLTFRIFGQVEAEVDSAETFDEAFVEYTVVP